MVQPVLIFLGPIETPFIDRSHLHTYYRQTSHPGSSTPGRRDDPTIHLQTAEEARRISCRNFYRYFVLLRWNMFFLKCFSCFKEISTAISSGILQEKRRQQNIARVEENIEASLRVLPGVLVGTPPRESRTSSKSRH